MSNKPMNCGDSILNTKMCTLDDKLIDWSGENTSKSVQYIKKILLLNSNNYWKSFT